jgi:DMSO/TMAO reductase YedYZ molybdopterin-dependent catalytic subunit
MGRKNSSSTGLDRRSFLGAAALSVALEGTSARADKTEDGAPFSGLITRESQPENLESSFAALDGFITPNNLFFVRSHFDKVKGLDARTWRLKVEGAVERPLELDYEGLRKMPARTQVALLECAGNGRVFLVPKASGLLWELGGVSNAEWTGVPLAAVLERAGLKAHAVEVIAEGADAGEIRDEPRSPGKIPFARSLPLDKAKQPEVLLAYQMNGADLPPAHGYPVRLLVPGWYGMASVKWLTRLVVTDRPFNGFFQTLQYAYFERRHGEPTLVTTTAIQVKAQIARPALGEVVKANAGYRMHGAAWTGESEIKKVDVSTDGGKNWQEAKLLDRRAPEGSRYGWRLWEYRWQTPEQPGRYTLLARATDQQGHTQPLERDPDRRSYMISHVLPVEVEVR